MIFSVYNVLIPALIQGLTQLKTILIKGSDYANAKGFSPDILINSRLAPDMHPLVRHVQITTDIAKGAVARLAGVTVPSYADEEKTFEELYHRIDKTLDFIKTFKREDFDQAETREISLKFGKREMDFMAPEYLSLFVFPNFYFHYTTSYALLRHNGVDVGKMDFLGKR